MSPLPRAGLSDRSLAMLRQGVSDPETVIRYRAKIARISGLECRPWASAISGRGHGRFWLGSVAGRDVTMIAHRFGWALEMGVESLLEVPVLKHKCDNPLCQRIGPGHVQASTYKENRAEWAARRHTVGSSLRDERGSRGRARAVRDLLRARPSIDAASLAEVAEAGLWFDKAQLPLWPGEPAGFASALLPAGPWPS